MHRFYLPPEKCRGESFQLDGREAHHALHVLRLKRGDRVTVLNGIGASMLCQVDHTSKDLLGLTAQESIWVPASPCSMTLLVAIPKGKIIEDIIQKAVELGVQQVVPLLSERVITQLDATGAGAKQEKWQQAAVEAIKQCGAAWLPKVDRPQTIQAVLDRQENAELSLVGSLQTERQHPRDWIAEFQRKRGKLPTSASVWIGPEGDFTLEELKRIEAAGAKPITLGNLVLRVETAAIYCLSFLNYELRR